MAVVAVVDGMCSVRVATVVMAAAAAVVVVVVVVVCGSFGGRNKLLWIRLFRLQNYNLKKMNIDFLLVEVSALLSEVGLRSLILRSGVTWRLHTPICSLCVPF